MPIPSDALVARLRQLGSTVVSDVLDECGYPDQALQSSIRPLDLRMVVAGRAVCFSGSAVLPRETGRKHALSTYEMDKRIGRDGVAVIATDSHAVSAVVGDLMCLAFSQRGCAGIVCDGGVRDASAIVEIGLPTFSRFVTPMRSTGRWELTDADSAVALPGQAVDRVGIEPGDYLVGDADGVMVIPAAIAEDVIGWSEQLAAIESAIASGLKTGQPRERVFGENPRFGHIRRLR